MELLSVLLLPGFSVRFPLIAQLRNALGVPKADVVAHDIDGFSETLSHQEWDFSRTSADVKRAVSGRLSHPYYGGAIAPVFPDIVEALNLNPR
ncbi:MAG: hypothetical protein GVY04_14980 [Cyanobacteria bacterium]|jgi:hypothetical protein|nr:hypothetical protein [Cyanobacteria bacterium GSL.Bin1]